MRLWSVQQHPEDGLGGMDSGQRRPASYCQHAKDCRRFGDFIERTGLGGSKFASMGHGCVVVVGRGRGRGGRVVMSQGRGWVFQKFNSLPGCTCSSGSFGRPWARALYLTGIGDAPH